MISLDVYHLIIHEYFRFVCVCVCVCVCGHLQGSVKRIAPTHLCILPDQSCLMNQSMTMISLDVFHLIIHEYFRYVCVCVCVWTPRGLSQEDCPHPSMYSSRL